MDSMRVKDFDMRYTVESAQPLTFFGDISDNGRHLKYQTRNCVIELEQSSSILHYKSSPDIGAVATKKEIVERFGLNDDIARMYEAIATDRFIAEAIAKYPGMRVTKNDPWETTVCFIVSQFNNVKRIRGIVGRLIDNYGELHSVEVNGKWSSFRSFPTPDALAGIAVKEMMKKCGTGFRAKYIIGSAQMCAESFDLNRLHKKSIRAQKRS